MTVPYPKLWNRHILNETDSFAFQTDYYSYGSSCIKTRETAFSPFMLSTVFRTCILYGPTERRLRFLMALTLGVLPSSSTSFDSIIFWICSPMSQKRTSMPTTLIPKGGGREGGEREGGREGGRVGQGLFTSILLAYNGHHYM